MKHVTLPQTVKISPEELILQKGNMEDEKTAEEQPVGAPRRAPNRVHRDPGGTILLLVDTSTPKGTYLQGAYHNYF